MVSTSPLSMFYPAHFLCCEHTENKREAVKHQLKKKKKSTICVSRFFVQSLHVVVLGVLILLCYPLYRHRNQTFHLLLCGLPRYPHLEVVGCFVPVSTFNRGETTCFSSGTFSTHSFGHIMHVHFTDTFVGLH